MFRRASGEGAGGSGAGEAARPNLTGDLDTLLGSRPLFRTRPRGYDRLEVDNYAAWVEAELVSARSQLDQLLTRFGACAAELEISRRMLADAPRGREVFPVSDRVEEMMRLAAEEAAALTEAGAQEAERLLAEARIEADARLRKAHEIKELAIAAADELREQAHRERAEVAVVRSRARSEAAEILQAAVAERERLDEEAAERRQLADRAATDHLLTVQEQVDRLRSQRDEARESLRRLTDQIGRALQAVAGTLPDAPPAPDLRSVPTVRMVDNIVSDDRAADGAPDGSAAEAPEERVFLAARP